MKETQKKGDRASTENFMSKEYFFNETKRNDWISDEDVIILEFKHDRAVKTPYHDEEIIYELCKLL